jgi:hypothetical protein
MLVSNEHATDAALASVRIHLAPLVMTRFVKLGVNILHTLHEGKSRKYKAESR